MKLVYGTVLAAGLIAGTLLAQQETVKMGQKMKDDMAAHMAEMKQRMASKDMDGHREMAQLIEKLSASMTAIEHETDAGALHAKMAEHRKLIEELAARFQKMHPAKGAQAVPADPHAGHR